MGGTLEFSGLGGLLGRQILKQRDLAVIRADTLTFEEDCRRAGTCVRGPWGGLQVEME